VNKVVQWFIAGLAIAAPLRAQSELPEEVDPAYALYFSSGQYHEIFSRAMSQIAPGEGAAALGHYRLGYVFERGLGRLGPALAHYYAGLEELAGGTPDALVEGLLAAGISRCLRTRYEQIENPVAWEVSVLVKGRSAILAPAKDIAAGRTPRSDTRYPLSKAPLPLGKKWVYIRVDRSGPGLDQLQVGERGRRFLSSYQDEEFRVRVRDVIRFFVEEKARPRPDTVAAIAGYAEFARRHARSPLASWARRRVRELEGGAPAAGDLGPVAGVVMADVDVDIPRTGAVNLGAVGVVVGNRDYSAHSPDVPDVEFARRDAQVVKQYLIAAMGFQEGNILYFENATHAVFRRVFGTREVREGRLAQLVKPGKSDVFIYYSGHGAPDVGEQQGYFVPVDGAPGDVRLNGYSLDLFYENLQQIEARSITVAIDACFSGGSQQGMLIPGASPVGIRVTNPALRLVNGAVFTSSSGDEISSWYPEMGHGLFTYFFLRGLQGEADADGDGRISMGELRDFVGDRSEGVPYWARRLYQGRVQTPGFYGDAARIVLTIEK